MILRIVDLLRNDLSKVCDTGSVKVGKYPILESYKNVYHLVAEVTGLTKVFHLDLVNSVFPCGSIIDAPFSGPKV